MKTRIPTQFAFLLVLLIGSQTKLFIDYSGLKAKIVEDETSNAICSVFDTISKDNSNGIAVKTCARSAFGKYELVVSEPEPQLKSILDYQLSLSKVSAPFNVEIVEKRTSDYELPGALNYQQAVVNIQHPSRFDLLIEEQPLEFAAYMVLLMLIIVTSFRSTQSGLFRDAEASGNDATPIYKIGLYQFDWRNQTLVFDGGTRRLTERECQILKYLFERKNQLVKRDEILTALWGENDYFKARSMDVFMARIRKYLSSDPQLAVENVRGVGFVLNAP